MHLHHTCLWVTRFKFVCHHFVFQHPQTGKLHELPSVVSKQQPLEIYDPVKVEPTPLVLLWDPVSEFKYTHTLKVPIGPLLKISPLPFFEWSCCKRYFSLESMPTYLCHSTSMKKHSTVQEEGLTNEGRHRLLLYFTKSKALWSCLLGFSSMISKMCGVKLSTCGQEAQYIQGCYVW